MIYEKAKAQLDTEFLAAIEESKNYRLLFTPEYLSYLATDALTSNLALILGDQIPNIQIAKWNDKKTI